MAGEMPPAGGGGQGELLQRKLGPMPVWVWALIGLAGAWLYAKWRSNQQAASAAQQTQVADTSSAESQQVAPQFVIENNLPPEANPGTATPPSQAGSPTPAPPVVAPPGKGTHPPIGHPPIPAGPPKPISGKRPLVYRVQHGDTLDSIAASHGVKGGGGELFTFNTTPGNRPPATINTLRKRGPNLIYPGEEILIPQN